MGSAAVSLPAPTVNPALLALYEGADNPDVMAHLTAHPEVVSVLFEAESLLRDAYGSSVVLRLDPPYFEGDELIARVYRHGMNAELADAHMVTFDGWWLAVEPGHDDARRWLEFGVGWGARCWDRSDRWVRSLRMCPETLYAIPGCSGVTRERSPHPAALIRRNRAPSRSGLPKSRSARAPTRARWPWTQW